MAHFLTASDNLCLRMLQPPPRTRHHPPVSSAPRGKSRLKRSQPPLHSGATGDRRLIDAYGDGLLEKEEFELRLRAAKERLARLQGRPAAKLT